MGKFAIALLFTWSAQALGLEMLFGPEFTVGNDEMLQAQELMPANAYLVDWRESCCNNPVIRRQVDAFHGLLYSKYVDSRSPKDMYFSSEVLEPNELRVFYQSPNGFDVWVGVDPAVIEMGTSPMTVEDFKRHRNELQEFIFETPKTLGMTPQVFTGGGHINLSVQHFKSNPRLLIRFVADLINHPELAMGAFGFDTNNAIHVRMVDRHIHYINAFMKELYRKAEDMDWLQLLLSLESILTPQHRADLYLRHWRGENVQGRGTAYSVALRNHTGDVQNFRVELRAVRPQDSMDTWIKQISLLQGRINYLERFDDFIPIANDIGFLNAKIPIAEAALQPPVDPQAAIARFYQYVIQSGEAWTDHQDYLWPQWVSDGELDRFNQSFHFSCNSAFDGQ